MTPIEKFNILAYIYSQKYPKFNIKFKDESRFMKFIGILLFFNKNFMTNYITTIGNTIYFPTQKTIEDDLTLNKLKVLSHELRHIHDSSPWYKAIFYNIGYLFPQILAPFMLLFCIMYWWLGLSLFVIMLLPWPAPFRKMIEIRGYSIDLLVSNIILKKLGANETTRVLVLNQYVYDIDDQFTTSAYYYMWPFGVKRQLSNKIKDITSGKFSQEDEFAEYIQNSIQQVI